MADDPDPWAAFRKPGPPAVPVAPPAAPASAAPSADPWAPFKAPAQGSPTPSPATTSAPIGPSAPGAVGATTDAPASAYDPTWKPSGNALWDFMSRPRAQTEGVGQAASDFGSTIADAATFGGADKLQSLITGEDVNAIRARTADAGNRLGIMYYPAAAVGYGAVPGAGAEALGLRGAGLVRGALSGAAEGAAASGLGTVGHGGSWSDAAKAAEVGGATGLLTGGLTGAFSRGPQPQGPTDANLFATAKQNFDDAGLHLFDNADIRQSMMTPATRSRSSPTV